MLGVLRAAYAAQAQVMSADETAVRLGGVRHTREQTLGVMFFGTLEISWMAPGYTAAWGEGLRRNLYGKAKGRRAFVAAVQMVRALVVADLAGALTGSGCHRTRVSLPNQRCVHVWA